MAFNYAGILVDEGKGARALQNLERVRHVGGTRHAGEIAFDLRIEVQIILLVLLSSRESPTEHTEVAVERFRRDCGVPLAAHSCTLHDF